MGEFGKSLEGYIIDSSGLAKKEDNLCLYDALDSSVVILPSTATIVRRLDKIEKELNMQNNKEPEVFKEGSQVTFTKIEKPTPEYIKTEGLCTIVKWMDGSVTKVKCSKNDGKQESSVYMAFCAALAKKIYGTNSKLHRLIDEHTTEYLEAEQKRIKEENKKAAVEAEKKAHRRKVKHLAKQMKLEQEAKAMLFMKHVDEEM